jgi:NAD(P)-dependent dehydrogenase (short-subunit alcohol dehydrogenase family)
MNAAQGIHDHPTRKLGLRPPTNAPALMLAEILSGSVPAHPAAADHFGKLQFALYGNDRYGDCGPTSVANLVRLVSAGLTGRMVAPSQGDVFDLYRRSGNPGFDPATGADDNGVVMQEMLDALLAGGIGGLRPVAFAKVDVTSDDELNAAVSIFGGLLWGVTLEVAQQQQTDQWAYQKTDVWGGHAVVNGAYSGVIDVVVSWAERIRTLASFRRFQLDEAWAVIWPWNLDHPAFQEGVDVSALADAYHRLTGKTLPVPTPAPTPAPTNDLAKLLARLRRDAERGQGAHLSAAELRLLLAAAAS